MSEAVLAAARKALGGQRDFDRSSWVRLVQDLPVIHDELQLYRPGIIYGLQNFHEYCLTLPTSEPAEDATGRALMLVAEHKQMTRVLATLQQLTGIHLDLVMETARLAKCTVSGLEKMLSLEEFQAPEPGKERDALRQLVMAFFPEAMAETLADHGLTSHLKDSVFSWENFMATGAAFASNSVEAADIETALLQSGECGQVGIITQIAVSKIPSRRQCSSCYHLQDGYFM
jgi:hypothetical protein